MTNEKIQESLSLEYSHGMQEIYMINFMSEAYKKFWAVIIFFRHVCVVDNPNFPPTFKKLVTSQ